MHLKNATILVVDDEPDLLEILAEWFRREGSRVMTAVNGVEALETISANQVHVVVTDVRMPLLDGIALLKKVKASDNYRSSVMFISGFTDILPRDAYDLGVEAVLSKPVERKDLIAVVTRVLAERDELWCLPPARKSEFHLEATFDSLAVALSQGLLAFGRGGFCIHSALELREGPVDLRLDFQADKRMVNGSGVIRWIASPDPEIGVEITYIDDDNRSWILSLTGPNKSHSFIPRTTAVAALPALKIEV